VDDGLDRGFEHVGGDGMEAVLHTPVIDGRRLDSVTQRSVLPGDAHPG